MCRWILLFGGRVYVICMCDMMIGMIEVIKWHDVDGRNDGDGVMVCGIEIL